MKSGREAILDCARRAFAQSPYAEVSLRGIAAGAGVSPSLIVKHFGGKKGLYAATADFGPLIDDLLAAPVPRLGRHMVLILLRAGSRDHPDPLLRAVLSLGGGEEGELLRARLEEQLTGPLAALLEGPESRLRAELAVGHLLGLSIVSGLGGDTAAASADRIADLYAPTVQGLVDGDGRFRG